MPPRRLRVWGPDCGTLTAAAKLLPHWASRRMGVLLGRYMPVRESGSFVKSPSFMLKKMQFVRDYELQNGVSIPQRTESRVETQPVTRALGYLSRVRAG